MLDCVESKTKRAALLPSGGNFILSVAALLLSSVAIAEDAGHPLGVSYTIYAPFVSDETPVNCPTNQAEMEQIGEPAILWLARAKQNGSTVQLDDVERIEVLGIPEALIPQYINLAQLFAQLQTLPNTMRIEGMCATRTDGASGSSGGGAEDF